MRLQDPELTKVLIVTLAETTPVLEAAELQGDLERAGIHPWAWVINNSLAAAHPRHRSCVAAPPPRIAQIAAAAAHTDRIAVIPLLADEPIGEKRLAALATRPRTEVLPVRPRWWPIQYARRHSLEVFAAVGSPRAATATGRAV